MRRRFFQLHAATELGRRATGITAHPGLVLIEQRGNYTGKFQLKTRVEAYCPCQRPLAAGERVISVSYNQSEGRTTAEGEGKRVGARPE